MNVERGARRPLDRLFPRTQVPAAGSRVAVVDDDPEEAYATGMVLRLAGYEPVEVAPQREAAERMLQRVTDSCVAAVFDHRLNGRINVPFDGAELASLASQRGFPAVLSSTYISRDQATTIRLRRAEIPCLLDKDEQSAESIQSAFEAIVAEFHGDTPRTRLALPTIIEIVGVHVNEEMPTAEVLVPAWRPSVAIQLPAGLITQDTGLGLNQLRNRWVEAEVNCHAERERDLFFRNFAISPDLPADWMRP
ncbi:hypothetical protein [Streptomyces sp. NPDC056323]|uniref:hypothetical protein n=1 Tax=Streptomyces sp. NPDC056323 TaxID=3345784 RepID=UPI0035D82858